MCPSGYHHNGPVAAHAPGRMMHGYTLLVVLVNIHIYYAHIASTRFEHPVCPGLPVTAYNFTTI